MDKLMKFSIQLCSSSTPVILLSLFTILVFLSSPGIFIDHKVFGQTTSSTTLDNPNQSIPQDKIKSYQALSLETGKPVTIQNTTGKLIILNSWATWCIPCREEMPGLEQLYTDYKDKGLEIIGTSVDSIGMDDRIKNFAERMNITYTLWHDPNDAFTRTFKAIGVPESYLIDKNGTIYHQWKGQFNPMASSTKSIIENALLKVNPPAFATSTTNTNTNNNTNSSLSGSVSDSQSSSDIASQGDLESGNGITAFAIPIAFVAGLLSFLSPCILPIIPSFVAFITGMSSDELLNKGNKRASSDSNAVNSGGSGEIEEQHAPIQKTSVIKSMTFLRGCLFILGFSIVFVALGASITAIGSAFHDYSRWIEIIGGIMIILFGLNLLGVLKIPGAQRDRGYKFSQRPAGHVGSLLIGMGFGAGWTPCIGPILASILTIAAVTTSLYEGIFLLVVYSAGLAIPFIISALAIDKYLVTYRKLSKYMPWIHRISVALLLIMGVLLLTGYLTLFTTSLASTFPMLG